MPQLPFARVDSDPLLEFSSEPGAPASAVQPAEKAEDALPPAAEASLDPLRKRVEVLERSLDRATKDVARLKSQVATLVGASRDIKPRSSHRAVSAAAGIAVGIALSVSMWIYANGDEPIMIRPAAAPPDAAVAPPVPVEPKPIAQTEVAAPTPVMRVVATAAHLPREQSRPAKSIDYVGTLSIDASPGGNVFVNREQAGHTPLRLEKLKAGSHLIWIERDGFRRWTKVVEVPADRVSRVFANLEPIASR